MYSFKQRKKAVDLYIKYGCNTAAVKRELGYPDRHVLVSWYKEYLKEGKLRKDHWRKKYSTSNYSEKQMKYAVKYYLEHGKNLNATINKLGYPQRARTLSGWLSFYAPKEKRVYRTSTSTIKYPQEVKEQAVIDFCTTKEPANIVAKRHNVSRPALYFWTNQIVGADTKMRKEVNESDLQALRDEATQLKAEVRKLRLERDVLSKAAEVLKKDKGISLTNLTNREKTIVIDALRKAYKLKDLLGILNMAKSSYSYQEIALHKDKYANLRDRITFLFEENNRVYGYRRIHDELKKQRIFVSEKVIRRIMKSSGMKVVIKMMRKYNSYKGELTPPAPNLFNRDFHAEQPNQKWITDITEFHIPAGKVYLSPIIDCFDGIVVSWTIGTSPNSELTNKMLLSAISQLNGEKPILHSDRGFHYRTNSWIQIMKDSGLTRSMSKKGCSPDNSACEGFFGRLKNEMFYNRKWSGISIDEFSYILDSYIHWYNEKRIKMCLGGLSPIDYRRNLRLIA